MTRDQAIEKLVSACLEYHLTQKFSLVGGLVYQAAVQATRVGQSPAYMNGYIDATISTVEALASKTEADTLGIVLSALRSLLNRDTPIQYSGMSVALIALECFKPRAA